MAEYTGMDARRARRNPKPSESEGQPIKDFEYLLHHVIVNDSGKEELHHCFLYDHIGNMFEQKPCSVKNGEASIGGKRMPDGEYHIISGLEPTQEVAWSDEEAKEYGITPKRMVAGMSAKQKVKEW